MIGKERRTGGGERPQLLGIWLLVRLFDQVCIATPTDNLIAHDRLLLRLSLEIPILLILLPLCLFLPFFSTCIYILAFTVHIPPNTRLCKPHPHHNSPFSLSILVFIPTSSTLSLNHTLTPHLPTSSTLVPMLNHSHSHQGR